MAVMNKIPLPLAVATIFMASGPATLTRAGSPAAGQSGPPAINHLVIIYQENHSFDNLYGGWEGVNGLGSVDAEHRVQVAQDGQPFVCLPQDDPNLTAPAPLPVSCKDAAHQIESAFSNNPFLIDRFIAPTAATCPNGKPGGTPGGCTRDLVHRFYQEQYQLNRGRMNRYVTGSDALGLTMGLFDTKRLAIYRYLHGPDHPHYVIADNFFQGAFGGSFANHQWLIAAALPVFPEAVDDGSDADLHSIVDTNGMPTKYDFYTPTTAVKDAPLTARCSDPIKALGLACGDVAVNTIQPAWPPYAPGTPAAKRLPPSTNPTIGDTLSAAGIDWAWYAGGWSNANGAVNGPGWTNGDGSRCTDENTIKNATPPYCADRLFQFHHQPFNYYAAFDPSTAAGKANREAHLLDEAAFFAAATASQTECGLKAVSFIKPIGAENEHPGYASESRGDDHVVALIRAIVSGRCATDTAIIVTYDEFGGQWDHVPPPGQGNDRGPHDQWGPGTRVPTLLISPFLRGDAIVDRTQYDTTSILATIERRYGLKPLGTRDAHVNGLGPVLTGPIHAAADSGKTR